MNARLLAIISMLLASAWSVEARAQPAAQLGDIEIPEPAPLAPARHDRSSDRQSDNQKSSAGSEGALNYSANDADDVFVPGKKRRWPTSMAAPKEPMPPSAPEKADEAVSGATQSSGNPSIHLPPLLLPPKDGDAQLRAAWMARQRARAAGAMMEALEHEKRIVQLRQELGYRNLLAMSALVGAEAEDLLASDPVEALRSALLAVDLAPDSPYARWTAARAIFANDASDIRRHATALLSAIKVFIAEPRWRGAVIAELGAFGLLAFLLAGMAVLVLVFLRHAHCALHDFHHLFPAGAARWQTALVLGLALVSPLVFSLGPAAFATGLAMACWLYASRQERRVIAACLLLWGLVPWSAAQIERWSAFAGTPAEVIWLVEHGGPEESQALNTLQAYGEQPHPSFASLFALGRRARLRGDIGSASTILRKAAELKSGFSPALVELGNVLLIRDDLDGAQESYQRAVDNDPLRASAYFNLARLHARRAKLTAQEENSAELAKSQEYGRKAKELDPSLSQSLAAEATPQANGYLASTTLQSAMLADLAVADLTTNGTADLVGKFLFGPLPRLYAFPALLLLVMLLYLLGFFAKQWSASVPCCKCGRLVCRRCDAPAVGTLCGQCIPIFTQLASIEPTVKAAKEMDIHRFQHSRAIFIKTSSILLAGAGQVFLGATVRGAVCLFIECLLVLPLIFGKGLVPVSCGYFPVSLKMSLLVLGVIGIWLWSAWRASRMLAAQSAKKESPRTLNGAR